MTLSVAIATRNRSGVLRGLLESLEQQVGDSRPAVEAVVVDDESSDDTAAVVRAFAVRAAFPVRYLYRPSGGLSVARNVAAQEATGKFVAFVDDDVRLAPGWLRAVETLTQSAPHLALAGGRVALSWPPGTNVEWLDRRYWWLYAYLDYGAENRPLRDREVVNGCNLLVSREVFLKQGGFDPALGHRGNQLGGSEEHELLTRVRRRYPNACYYAGEALAYHQIPPARATREWALERVRAASRHRAHADRRHASWRSLAARRAYYQTVLLSARVLGVGELRVAECAAYLEGLRDTAPAS